jgi:hypothetical protein
MRRKKQWSNSNVTQQAWHAERSTPVPPQRQDPRSSANSKILKKDLHSAGSLIQNQPLRMTEPFEEEPIQSTR